MRRTDHTNADREMIRRSAIGPAMLAVEQAKVDRRPELWTPEHGEAGIRLSKIGIDPPEVPFPEVDLRGAFRSMWGDGLSLGSAKRRRG